MEMNLSKIRELVSKAFQAAVSAGKALASYGKECFERQQRMKRYSDECRSWELFHSFQLNLQADYDAFADAVYKCLQSNHQKLGLSRLNSIEDVCCETDWQRVPFIPHIGGNGQNIVFRYEADRLTSETFLGGMKKLECPRVATEEITTGLHRELPKYTKRRGYGFTGLDVIDIPGNKVRITVSGVHRISAPQMTYPQRIHTWGADLYD